MNTPATRVRSSARPVSFSTIEARITSSCGRLDRQIGRAALPDLAQSLALRRLHGVDDLLARHAALELVGVGQQRAFARRLVDVAGEESFSQSRATICSLVRPSGIVTECRMALPSTRVSIASSMLAAGLELELAGLQLPALAVDERIGLEQERLVDDALRASECSAISPVPVLRGITHHLVGLPSGPWR